MQLRRLTSPMICSRQGGDQDSWSCVSSPKTNRCEIQELLMFQFKLKGKKRMMAQLKALREEKFALNLQRGKPFFFFFSYSGSQWIEHCPPTLGTVICFTQMSFLMYTYIQTVVYLFKSCYKCTYTSPSKSLLEQDIQERNKTYFMSLLRS